MILTHLVVFSFFDGASGSDAVVTPTVTPAVGHVGRKRRRVIIDDVIYEGTDEQIEAKLWEILQAREEAPKPKPKKAKKRRPVRLKQDYVPVPMQIDMPRFHQLMEDTYRHEDAFTRSMLKRMLERMDDEDVELLLLAM